jgi:hypothetical protein
MYVTVFCNYSSCILDVVLFPPQFLVKINCENENSVTTKCMNPNKKFMNQVSVQCQVTNVASASNLNARPSKLPSNL